MPAPGSAKALLNPESRRTEDANGALKGVASAQRFLQDAKPNTPPQFYSFLSTAAQPFIGASTVDPYPYCLS